MKITCFECDAPIEGPDADAIVEGFLTHARERHSWSYPEQALRNYARNFAEAPARLTGGTERLAAIGEITVHPMTADRVDDWLRFFDHDGFADNPDWASCYCLTPHTPAPPECPERPWRETLGIMSSRLRCGSTFGYLAYVDGRTAGWVNASLRSEYDLFRTVDSSGPAPASVIGVSCFVIAPPFRRHGIAAALLDRVIADATSRGAAWIEAYPHNQPNDTAADHFRGPRSIYESRRFEVIEVREHETVMRRAATLCTPN